MPTEKELKAQYQAQIRRIQQHQIDKELSDDELEKIAGGYQGYVIFFDELSLIRVVSNIRISIEQRGRTTKMSNSNKGRPKKKPLSPDIEEDLIAENQRLREENQYMRMEIDYIKKLSALVLAEEQKSGKKQK